MDRSKCEVLLIDDDLGDRLLIRKALLETSWVKAVQIAKSPQQAIRMLYRLGVYRKSPTPGLILCDFHMPEGGGMSVLEYVKAKRQLRRLPIAMFSSDADSRTIGDCYGRGATIYLRKPQNFETLQRMMEELGNLWKKVEKDRRGLLRSRILSWWRPRETAGQMYRS